MHSNIDIFDMGRYPALASTSVSSNVCARLRACGRDEEFGHSTTEEGQTIYFMCTHIIKDNNGSTVS